MDGICISDSDSCLNLHLEVEANFIVQFPIRAASVRRGHAAELQNTLDQLIHSPSSCAPFKVQEALNRR